MLATTTITHFCVKCYNTFIQIAEDFLICLTGIEHMPKIMFSFEL